ncbi:hypothetical protein CFP65_7053 [Kitasatospora sp. MMS16-BH015]|uniref:hypothetical protein n=1 Tax=Kitasatospora sp. MMS16-BH015 TaxID=2018025 RepID=UPI000CA383BB|nr:hypothetical protein [Kitasatospora sp. MMS16-BH015]AUG81658.1 hypothetical protein CFP65_7053 [Kitasatospora sp. MMS16-BH015]
MTDGGAPSAGGFDAAACEAFDLCDLCGEIVADEDLLGALVPDSSALHESDPDLDGKRVVTACTAAHLVVLVEQYRDRPFVPEEQWAAKVCRALAEFDEPVTLSLVAELSGLSEQQAQSGVDWHNDRAREWRARYGGADSGGADS